MWSCRNGALRVAERLVDAGASPRAVSKKGVSCLHWAVWGQQPELAGWLLSPPRSLELEGRSEAGCNAAVWAAASGGLAIAQWLHEQGADFTSLNHWGHGVVNKAAWRGHLELLRWMFAALPATIEQLFLRDYAVWKTDASCPAHSLILDFVLSLSWQTNCCIIIGKRSPFDTTPVLRAPGFRAAGASGRGGPRGDGVLPPGGDGGAPAGVPPRDHGRPGGAQDAFWEPFYDEMTVLPRQARDKHIQR